MVLKRKLGPKTWAIEAFVGAVLRRRERRSLVHGFVASNPREKGFNFASKRGMNFGVIGPRSGHDRAAIGP